MCLENKQEITFTEFLKLVPVYVYKQSYGYCDGNGHTYPLKVAYGYEKTNNKDNPGLYFSVHIGGYTGGNCYGDKSSYKLKHFWIIWL